MILSRYRNEVKNSSIVKYCLCYDEIFELHVTEIMAAQKC